ncbi:MAG: glycosyltransferase family 2 protein, partial [Chitinophagaceae bacterium]|nr:glycosyltransferase family 2 protein [Chitinophagaceae bacterium]
MPFQVSVIIPVYNARPFIDACLESVLACSQVAEIILIDDASTDGSYERCLFWAQKNHKIQCLKHADGKNHGTSITCNVGIRAATKPYISFLGADDFYLPHRFDADEMLLNNNPSIDGIYSALGIHYYSEEAQLAFQQSGLQPITGINKPIEPVKLFAHLIGLAPFCGYFSLVCLTIKRETILKYNLFFHPNLRLHQDTELIYRMAYYTQLLGQEPGAVTALRGVHAGNRITQNRNSFQHHQNSMLLLEEAILSWVNNANIEAEYQTQLAYNFINRRLQTQAHRIKRLALLKVIIPRPSLW